MRGIGWLVVMAALGMAPSAAAQDDGDDSPAAAQIRQQIETRFAQQLQQTMGLSDQQAVKLRATFNKYGPARRVMEGEERSIKRALQGQLRPGIAANSDSVARLVNRLLDLKVEYAKSFVEENREMEGYLTPVQRAQFQVMRERLMARIAQIRENRQQRPQGSGVR